MLRITSMLITLLLGSVFLATAHRCPAAPPLEHPAPRKSGKAGWHTLAHLAGAARWIIVGQEQSAVEELNSAIQARPNIPWLYQLRAVLLARHDQLDAAIADLDRAIGLEPKCMEAYLTRAELLLERYTAEADKANSAGPDASVSQRTPAPPAAENTDGERSEQDSRAYGYLFRAIGDCTKALRIRGTSARAHMLRGMCYQSGLELGKAIDDFTAAMRCDPQDPAPHLSRADAYAIVVDMADGLKDVRSDDDAVTDFRAQLIEMKAQCGVKSVKEAGARALADYDTVLKLDPTSWVAYSGKATIDESLGDREQAVHDCSAAIRLAPDQWPLYQNRAELYYKQEKYKEAIADYSLCLRLGCPDGDVYCRRGLAFLELEDLEHAMADFNEALRLEPGDAAAYLGRSWVHSSRCDYTAAVADCRKAVELNPDDPDYGRCLAWLLATCPDQRWRDGHKALTLATAACKATAWKNSDCCDTLAAAYAELGRFEEAIQWQERALAGAADADRKELSGRLTLYRAHRPYRAPRSPGEPRTR